MSKHAELTDFNIWFYIVSARYRRRLHKQWRFEKWYYVLSDILVGIYQLVVVVALVGALIYVLTS